MRLFNFLFKGLRGKLPLTYTLVTVLALFALEIILLFSGLIFTDLVNPSYPSMLAMSPPLGTGCTFRSAARTGSVRVANLA